MPGIRQIRRKICLLGDAAVGKTSLIRRFVQDIFDDKYVVTLGTKVTMKELDIESLEKAQTMKITLMIWDILGQKELKRLQSSFYRGANGALIMADITRKETVDSLDDWILTLFNSIGKVPVLILLNKNDLRKQTTVEHWHMADLAKKYDTTCLLTSAKTGENVDLAFTRLSKMLVQKNEKERSPNKESIPIRTNSSIASNVMISQKAKISKNSIYDKSL